MTAKKAKKEKLVVFCIIHKIFYFNNVSIAEEKIVSSPCISPTHSGQ